MQCVIIELRDAPTIGARNEGLVGNMSELKLAQVAPKSPATLLQAVLAYKDIKAQITFLEEQLKGHKETIEAAASNTPDGKIVTEHFKVTLSICERENFKLKDAKNCPG